MARIRSIKIGFFKNEHLCELSPLHRLLFAGLWVLADKAGRLEDRPKRIKVELFPYDELDVDAMLTELADAGFIQRYEARGGRFIHVVEFLKHQRPHHKEPDSIIPAPPRLGRGKNGHASTMHDASMDDAAVDHGDSGPFEHGDDPLGSGSLDLGSGDLEKSNDAPRTETPLMEFPTVGTVKTWTLTQEKVDELRESYPNLDVIAECRKALAWCRNNRPKQKTAKGMPAFLANWLNKATDSGRGTPARSSAAPRVGSPEYYARARELREGSR